MVEFVHVETRMPMTSPPKPADQPWVWSLTKMDGAAESGCVAVDPSARGLVMGPEPKQAPWIVMLSELIDVAEIWETDEIEGGRQEERVVTPVVSASSVAFSVALVIKVVETTVMITMRRMVTEIGPAPEPSLGDLLDIRKRATWNRILRGRLKNLCNSSTGVTYPRQFGHVIPWSAPSFAR